MFTYDKTIKTKSGTYTYEYLAHSERVDGVSKRTWEVNLGRKDRIKSKLPLIKRKLSENIPQGQDFHFGLVTALYSICEDIHLIDTIDRCVDKRDQGFSVGNYLAILAINRAVALNSKNKVQEWFDETTLFRQFPSMSDALTPQNIWNQMDHLDQASIRKIEEFLCKEMIARFNIKLDCFLFDPTNFFTYIRDYKKNTIARRGHNKKKRNDLRQINTSLMVTRNDCNVPMMHETYQGNMSDATHFKEALMLMEGRFKALGLEMSMITLVFDKGNNSEVAYKLLESKHMHFVSSVRPSLKKVKPLLAVPLSEYELLWTKEDDKKVLGYRVMTDLYFGKGHENTLIVTFDDDTYALQEYNLDASVVKATTALQEFSTTMLNTKPQWKDPKKVTKKIDRDILANKELRKLIVYSLDANDDGLRLTWQVDADAREKALNELGKSFIFTDKNEWSMEEIVKTYRDQKGVEDQFKNLNKRSEISVMPMYHWTDQKIRVHVFISVLALLISNLLYRKLVIGGIKDSREECTKNLKKIKEIHLIYDDGYPPDITYTCTSKAQEKISTILDLPRFMKVGSGVVQN
jgi:transposase